LHFHVSAANGKNGGRNNDKSASLPQSTFAPSEGYDSVPFNVMEQRAVFVLILLKWLEKLTGVKDKYI
jgi:hypothetical protein